LDVRLVCVGRRVEQSSKSTGEDRLHVWVHLFEKPDPQHHTVWHGIWSSDDFFAHHYFHRRVDYSMSLSDALYKDKRTTQMTTDKLSDLYNAIKSGRKPTVRDLDPEARAAYYRERKRAQRARQRESADAGYLEPTADNLHAVLADAAIMLIATGAPGAAEILHAVSVAFPAAPGVVLGLPAKIRCGDIKPRLLTPERLRGAVSSLSDGASPSDDVSE
jgi:hypothetical protein